MSDTASPKKELLIIRVLRLMANIDWKGLAIIIGLLGGAVGSGFNTFMDYLRENRSERVQESSYELLATRLEELSQKVTMIELMLIGEDIEGPPEPEPEPRSHGASIRRRPASPEPVEVVEHVFDASPEEAIHEVEELKLIEARAADEVDVVYHNARLPNFKQIQQKAQEEEGLNEFVEEVKSR